MEVGRDADVTDESTIGLHDEWRPLREPLKSIAGESTRPSNFAIPKCNAID
jgi:hypothetical protein